MALRDTGALSSRPRASSAAALLAPGPPRLGQGGCEGPGDKFAEFAAARGGPPLRIQVPWRAPGPEKVGAAAVRL